MKMLRSFYIVFIILYVALTLVIIHAQDDQSGFISIDCGIPEGSKYTDKRTGITYVSDAGFTEGGVNGDIVSANNMGSLDHQLTTLRSFPQNTRDCYTLRPKLGKNFRYLIRLRFVYGNYDSKGQPPQFDIYIGEDLWRQPYIPDPSVEYFYEIIHLASSDYIHICLVNTGKGDPFVSSLELRLLDFNMFEPPSTSLNVFNRFRFGTNERVRYPDDKYDRIWNQWTVPGTRVIQTSNTVSLGVIQVPSKVMSTAITPTISTGAISLTWNASTISKFFLYIHFAEVEILKGNQTREFNIYLNGNYWYGPFSPSTNTTTVKSASPHTGFSRYTLEINKTLNSTLPPLINAIEIYTLKQFQRKQTEDQDVAAIWSTKSTYGLKRNWQGDPCFPRRFLWDGLGCNYSDPQAAKIISLNLSSSGLRGKIATALANLTMIESLDLSYNNLTGDVPEFFAQQDHLRILNLKGNNFTRPLPAELLAKSKKGSLLISIESTSDEDKSSCLQDSCKNKKGPKVVIPLITTVGSLIMLLTILAIIWKIKRRKTKDLDENYEPITPKKQQFSFSEVRSITNNFKTVIGKGGFGIVYHGYIGHDDQVAVKMLSAASGQGYNEFHTEVKLLMGVRHKNITSLVGYCDDNSNKGIIYEFMANGNLEKHLFDGIPNVLSWERRLQIACDAADGLVYMHHSCKTQIVHRDVKASNILLNEDFQAKLGDFGVSRAFTTEDATHVSTVVAGTYGYLDPEYFLTSRLTVKSDVYSFGVVLLELITSRRAISNDGNIVDWVKLMAAEGSVDNLIDPRLEGGFNISTAGKVVELAISCASHTSIERPTMNDVAIELKNCLNAEETSKGVSNNEREYTTLNLEDMSDPTPR